MVRLSFNILKASLILLNSLLLHERYRQQKKEVPHLTNRPPTDRHAAKPRVYFQGSGGVCQLSTVQSPPRAVPSAGGQPACSELGAWFQGVSSSDPGQYSLLTPVPPQE